MVSLAAAVAHGAITRGPYLQLVDATGITVVFRTDTTSVATVRYGAGQSLTATQSELVPTTEHVVRLTGLSPSTRYGYELEIDGVPMLGGEELHFRTAPFGPEPFRFFAWGDSGTGTNAQLKVAARLADEVGDATFSLILGDIIYYLGEPQLYDARYFEPYAPLLRRMVIWPTIGNHDVGLDPLGGPYLDAFHLPSNNPANTELYYSFDYGDAHFVCLDTHVSGHAANSAQVQWAAADLAASNAKWKIAYFHVPPYSGGSHPDDPGVRDGLLPTLEAGGVDVVFSGHSHVYERTFLLSNNTIVQGDASTYVKSSADGGTLYVVSGTAGQSDPVSNPMHPLMAFQVGNTLGASVMDVSGDSLRGYFLAQDGSAVDLFRLSKGADVTPARLLAARANSPTELEVSFDEPMAVDGGVELASRWSISPTVAVTGAQLSSDARTVRLSTAVHAPGDYVVSVNMVSDALGNRGNANARYPVRTQVRLSTSTRSTSVAPPVEWRTVAFDDTSWTAASMPLGFGASSLSTVLAPAATVYARVHFTPPAVPLRALVLSLDYDDGFVASLNGVELLRQNVPANQNDTTLASSTREAGFVQRWVLPVQPSEVLFAGDNVLAIEAHDSVAAGGDVVLSAQVDAVLELSDAGVVDAGVPDAGGGDADAGEVDAGSDAGSADAGAPEPDAGPSEFSGVSGGCGCQSVDPMALVFALITIRRRVTLASPLQGRGRTKSG